MLNFRLNLDVYRFALCNGLGISTAVISVTISALVASHLGWLGAWSTVPYGVQFLAILIAAYPSSQLMARYGRKPVFAAAALMGCAGGVLGYYTVQLSSPLLLCVAHFMLGISLGNVNFYRFAALESSTQEQRATSMSLVVAGGTFAALLGPLFSRTAIFSTDVFASAYLSIAALSAIMFVLLGRSSLARTTRVAGLTRPQVYEAFQNKHFVFGMATAAISYGVMNLLMVAAAISMDICGVSYAGISFAIQYHVLAMFVPSLFMGRVIKAFGPVNVMWIGIMLMMSSAALSIYDPTSFAAHTVSLVFLGLAWNMMYVGGSFLASQAAPTDAALSYQAINDIVIGVSAMAGAFSPGLLMEALGWQQINVIVLSVVACLLTVPIGRAVRA